MSRNNEGCKAAIRCGSGHDDLLRQQSCVYSEDVEEEAEKLEKEVKTSSE